MTENRTDNPVKVFLSYAREDYETARKLCDDLRKAGADIWLDDDELIPGQDWRTEITKAIRKSGHFIALISTKSVVKRGFVQTELKKALEVLSELPGKDIFIIPARIDDCGIPDQLEHLHCADLFPDYERGFGKILKAIPGTKQAESQKPITPAGSETEKEFTNPLSMKFVYIKPGTFMMGSPENEPGRYDREIQHQVTLTSGFYMQTTQVTQGQWKAVMGNNPSSFKNCDDCPVESISWLDIQSFIKRLNELEKTDLYRLPTEAEWEYAARAGSDTAYCFGNDVERLKEYAWYYENSGMKTHPVAQLKPNAWGLYDMHGNVWEWCQDWYGDYPKDAVVNPTGADSGSFRVFRGGSWLYFARDCRSACRSNYSPVIRHHDLGFRLLREAH